MNQPQPPDIPAHGGNLAEAIKRFNRPREEWLDLSTGINPQSYPAPALAKDAWHRLPEPDAALTKAAQSYYRAPNILPIAGTQAAIQALPQCRMRSHGIARVAISAPTYAEHAYRWAQSGHTVNPYAYKDLHNALPETEVMVICNPNNPTGEVIRPQQLMEWHSRLADRGGWLIVDEAFADTTPETSIAWHTGQPGLIVLRSIGKFFGLAGLRLGFVASDESLLSALAEQIGPWTISTPAQQIGQAALSDKTWQQTTTAKLLKDGARLQALLKHHGIDSSGTALYQWWPLPRERAENFWLHMARRGIWVRLFAGAIETGIRLGLPPDETGWRRLAQAMSEWTAAAEVAA